MRTRKVSAALFGLALFISLCGNIFLIRKNTLLAGKIDREFLRSDSILSAKLILDKEIYLLKADMERYRNAGAAPVTSVPTDSNKEGKSFRK